MPDRCPARKSYLEGGRMLAGVRPAPQGDTGPRHSASSGARLPRDCGPVQAKCRLNCELGLSVAISLHEISADGDQSEKDNLASIEGSQIIRIIPDIFHQK